jgi:hypothetical protein
MKKGATSRNHNRAGRNATPMTFSLTWPWNNYTKRQEEETMRVQEAREENIAQENGENTNSSGFFTFRKQ